MRVGQKVKYHGNITRLRGCTVTITKTYMKSYGARVVEMEFPDGLRQICNIDYLEPFNFIEYVDAIHSKIN